MQHDCLNKMDFGPFGDTPLTLPPGVTISCESFEILA